MCLTHLRVEKGIRTRKVYKILDARQECGNGSIRLHSQCNFFDWSRGVNESGRPSTKVSHYEQVDNVIHDGFHVYRYKKDAENNCNTEYDGAIVVECIAKKEDYVASGRNNGGTEGMVYTRLTIPKAEYDKKVRKSWRAIEREEKRIREENADLPY